MLGWPPRSQFAELPASCPSSFAEPSLYLFCCTVLLRTVHEKSQLRSCVFACDCGVESMLRALSYYCPAPVHHQASRCNVSHCPKDDHTEYCMYGGAHAAAVLMC
eukprot:170663-Prorocentrum_minimum.AAC.1